MTYAAWTDKTVEERVLEATETLMLLPEVKGPQAYGNAMPEIVREKWKDADKTNTVAYRRRPNSHALDRMEETWRWINSLSERADRVLLYSWAWVKARKGCKIEAFAAEKDMNSRTLRREITRICQRIANNLNRLHAVRLNSEDCGLSENQPETDPSTLSSVKHATHWMAPDGKPQIDPANPKRYVLDNRRRRAG